MSEVMGGWTMKNAALSALVRKREAPKPAPGADYAPLLKVLTKFSQPALCELLRADAEVKARAAGSRRLAAQLAGAADPGVYYWLTDESGAPALLISVASSFAAALTERLLGGPLKLQDASDKIGALEFEMAGSLVDLLTPAVNAALFKLSPSCGDELFGGKKGLRLPAHVIVDREEMEVVGVSLDIEAEGASMNGFVQLYFARGVLEAHGLIAIEGGARPADTTWSAKMRRSLLTAEIPLTAIVDRIPSTVGDLSRLKVGQVIDIRDEALAGLELVATTVDGPATVAFGRLGAFHARKAVKLSGPIDPAFFSGL